MVLPKRAQASMEYIITYGWALVAIATIVSILFLMTTNPNTDICPNFIRLICKGITEENGDLVLVLQNAAGQKIIIDPYTDISFDGIFGYAIIVYNGQEHRFGNIEIGAGDEFTVKGTGMGLATSIAISFLEDSGLRKTETSPIKVKAKTETINACNFQAQKAGLYILERDLSTSSGDCITIDADNVTIDCQDHKISGSGSAERGIFATGRENTTLVNCDIEGFTYGITIENSPNATLGNNNASGNDFSGISLIDGANNSWVVNNQSNQNNLYGVFITNSTNVNFSNNSVNENSFNGAYFGSWSSIVLNNNTFCGNQFTMTCETEDLSGTGNIAENVPPGCTGFGFTENCP